MRIYILSLVFTSTTSEKKKKLFELSCCVFVFVYLALKAGGE